jgi:hypothetical protein
MVLYESTANTIARLILGECTTGQDSISWTCSDRSRILGLNECIFQGQAVNKSREEAARYAQLRAWAGCLKRPEKGYSSEQSE